MVAAATLTSACGSSHSGASAPACRALPEAIAPDTVGTLQDGDRNGTFCIHRGDVVAVFLHAPTGDARWGPVTADPASAVVPRTTGVMTLPLGVTAAIFEARRTRTVTLRSVRAPCDEGASSGCDTAHQWTARLVIRT